MAQAHLPRLLLAIVCWIVTTVLMVVVVIALRETLLLILVTLELHRYTIRLTNMVGAIVLGLGAMVTIMLVEHHYRTAASYTQLAVRFTLLAGIGVLLLFVTHAGHVLTALATGIFERLRLSMAGVELAVGLALLWLSSRLSRRVRSL